MCTGVESASCRPWPWCDGGLAKAGEGLTVGSSATSLALETWCSCFAVVSRGVILIMAGSERNLERHDRLLHRGHGMHGDIM